MKSPGTLINTEDALPTATDSDSVISRFESLYPSLAHGHEVGMCPNEVRMRRREADAQALLFFARPANPHEYADLAQQHTVTK